MRHEHGRDMTDLAGEPLPPAAEWHLNADLVELLEIPLRRPFHVLIPFVLITALCTGVSFIVPEMYRSSTVILVESEKVPESFVPHVASDTAKRLQTLRQEVLSRTRLERLLEELDPYPGATGKTTLSDTVERMRADTTINVKGNDAFTIEFVHRDARQAMLVANRLASQFIEEVTLERKNQVADATGFIESQLQDSRRQLEETEQAVRRYKEMHMGSLPEQMQANLATLQRLQLEQQRVAESLVAARQRQDAQIHGSASAVAAADPQAEIRKLRSQLVELRTRYLDEHPDVRQLKARIDALEKQLASQPPEASGPPDSSAVLARTQVAEARHETAALEARQRDLDQKIASLQARVDQSPRIEQELATMTRDLTKLNENYLALLSKKLDSKMAEKLEQRWRGEQFRVLDPAHTPERPYAPNRLLYLLAGLAGGLLAGLGVALLAELLDQSLKSVRDLENVLPFPVLGAIPDMTIQRRAKTGGPGLGDAHRLRLGLDAHGPAAGTGQTPSRVLRNERHR